jgi:hypothetical protein
MTNLEKSAYTVALVWRGDKEARERLRPDTSRFNAIFKALERRGLRLEAVLYDEEDSSAFSRRLRQMDAALVWVNPIDAGRTRNALDDILRDVASAGLFVSAHPDVVAKMGVKAVLHRTRTLGWGTDTRYYETRAAFEAEFPGLLAHGARVLKRNRGNGGIGVWKVESAGAGRVRVQEARGEADIRVLALEYFLTEQRDVFSPGNGLIDQPYQTRLTEGMIRCYVSGQQVAGFGHQMVRALAPKGSPSGPRLYSGPTDPRFHQLRLTLERDWIPQMAEFLDIRLEALPVIWDADFLLGPQTAAGDDSYVLCEINASSVFPIPDEAPDAIAATLLERLSSGRKPR